MADKMTMRNPDVHQPTLEHLPGQTHNFIVLGNTETGEFEAWTFRRKSRSWQYYDGVSFKLRPEASADIHRRLEEEDPAEGEEPHIVDEA